MKYGVGVCCESHRFNVTNLSPKIAWNSSKLSSFDPTPNLLIDSMNNWTAEGRVRRLRTKESAFLTSPVRKPAVAWRIVVNESIKVFNGRTEPWKVMKGKR